ncbi:MAG: class B sortase [Anaerorhabdus sp.]
MLKKIVIGIFIVIIFLTVIVTVIVTYSMHPDGLDGANILYNSGQVAPEINEEIIETLEEYQRINEDIVAIFAYKDLQLPIMNPGNNEAYFRTDIYGDYDSMGTPFVDETSNLLSSNVIIQGHASSKNDNMFSFIAELVEDSDSTFRIISEDGEVEYQMIGIAEVDLTQENNLWLGYYQQEFRSGEMEQMINEFLDRAFIQYGAADVDDTSKLVTLVTCDVAEENSRFIVIAKKK